jgi:hypothetical protein
MSRHLTDHRTDSTAGRVEHFLRITRSQSQAMWQALWQRRPAIKPDNRRVVEFVRIARQRQE